MKISRVISQPDRNYVEKKKYNEGKGVAARLKFKKARLCGVACSSEAPWFRRREKRHRKSP